MADQPLVFGLLGLGGILLVHAVTGESWTGILKGHAGSVSSQGATLSVAGAGATAGSVGSAILEGATGTEKLAPNASAHLNADQQAFASQLQTDLGLDPSVIAGWLLSEEPASASQAPNGANNWLNIGAFDSGDWAGGGQSVWDSPTTAADATAAFILGHAVNGVSAPFEASPGIHAIAESAGQSAQAQIEAIQNSGWASSGYPDLASTVALF